MAFTHEDAKNLSMALKDIQPLLEKYGETPSQSALADTEAVAVTPEARSIRNTYDDIVELRSDLILKFGQNPAALNRMIGQQMVKGAREGQGVPLHQWANQSTMAAIAGDPELVKLLDTAGGTALIRQDLEPLLYAAFVRQFPLFERIARQPSNGLVHAYDRVEEAPEAEFISELGTVPDGAARYTRATTNIAIAAIRVGTSLKMQFAARAGGSSWSPETEEINNGLIGLRRKIQQAFFHGNASVPGATDSDPEGLYDANGFDGLRVLVPSANTHQQGAGETILNALAEGDKFLSTTGGLASIIVMDSRDRVNLMKEMQPYVRLEPRVNVVPGLPDVEAVNLGNSGTVPILGVPGNEIGSYTDSISVRDAYLIEEGTLSAPWLGSEMPTVLDIPVGVAGQLTHLFILFMMTGLAMKVPTHQAKVQLRQ